MSVPYTTSLVANPNNGLYPDLNSLGSTQNNAFVGVHSARETYGADLITMLVDSGRTYGWVGLANFLTSVRGDTSHRAFSVCAIRAVANGHTLTHEIGHNLGAAHPKNLSSNAGPNPHLGDYAAGWYYTGSNSTKYYTIMGYNTNTIDEITTWYTPAPLFSTPLKSYGGAVAGHVADGDNARLLRETMDHVAGYRSPRTVNGNDSSVLLPAILLLLN